MRLAGLVPGYLVGDWHFVEDDMHHIAERISEFDPDARLGHDRDANRWAVVRHVQMPVIGDTWIIGFILRDQDGKELAREPDGRVMAQMRKYDTWRNRFSGRQLKQQAEKLLEIQAERHRKAIMDQNTDLAEQYVFHGRRYFGMKRNIYVPAGIEG